MTYLILERLDSNEVGHPKGIVKVKSNPCLPGFSGSFVLEIIKGISSSI